MSVAKAIVEHVLEHVIDGGLVVGHDGVVQYANGDTERIFARARTAIVGVELATLFDDLPEDWRTPGTRTLHALRSDGTQLGVRSTFTVVDDAVAVTLQDRASANPLPAMPDPTDDPDQMLVTIADAVDAFLYAGEMDPRSGWYLPIFHGPGLGRLLGGDVSYEDANRIFDTRVFPEDYPGYEALYDVEQRTAGVPMEVTYRLRGLDGKLRWLRERSVPRVAGGRWLLLGVIFDVTREIEQAEAVERERSKRLAAVARFERVVSLSNDLVIAVDVEGLVRYANPATRTLLGCEPADLVGAPWDRLAHVRDAASERAAVQTEFGSRSVGPRVSRAVGADGGMLHLSWTGAFDPVEGLMYYVGRDITVEIEARAAVEERARIDALTNLSNRRHVVEVLTSELERARREEGRPGLLMLDVDHFKPVNDAYGHAAGDAALVEIAERVRRAVRRYDVAGRWGGEEFCVVVPGITDEAALRRVGEAVRAAVAEAPIAVGGGRLVQLTLSIGGVVVEEGIWSVEALVDAADRALYAAKRHGRNRLLLASELTLEDVAAEVPEALRLAEALALSAGAREGMPESHPQEVADLAAAMAQVLGLTDDGVLRCRLGGWLHDLGKVGVPDRVLVKRGPLDPDEWALMRTHAEVGEGVVRRIPGLAQAAPIVRHHHERWDGAGYPDELAGEEIPLEARIVAVADTYSALTHDRVYRGATAASEALAEIVSQAGSQFDPRCVDALVAVIEGADVAAPVADVRASRR
ncbi:MAG: diguanylate cyclase [Gaiella sp.]